MKRFSMLVTASVFATFAFLGVGPSALAAGADANRLLILASSASGEQAAIDQLNDMGAPLSTDEVAAIAAGLAPNELKLAGGAALAQTEPVGWKFDDGDTFLAFQINDQGLNISSLTLVLDENLVVTQKIQSLASLTPREALEVRQWVDGKLVSTEKLEKSTAHGTPAVKATITSVNHAPTSSVTTTLAAQTSAPAGGVRGGLGQSVASAPLVTSVSSQQIANAPIVTAKWRGFSLSRFNSCLSSAGVAWWVVAMVASVCFAAGVATAGVAFMACVAGTLGVGSGTTGYCFGYATYY